MTWPQSFDALLRSYLTVDDGEEISPDRSLPDYGVDSMATVSLLLDLEEQYAVTISDDRLVTVAAGSIRALWETLVDAGADKGEDCTVSVGPGAGDPPGA